MSLRGAGAGNLTVSQVDHNLPVPGPAGPARVNPVRTVKVAAVSV